MSRKTIEGKIDLGQKVFRSLMIDDGYQIPVGSCIAQEIDKIAKRLRVKKVDLSQFRAAVYYPVWKINYDKKQNEDSNNIHDQVDDSMDCDDNASE